MDRPDKSGVWEWTTTEGTTMDAIVSLERDEVQLPIAEAPYRLCDLVAAGGSWRYLRERYRQEKAEE